MVYGFKVEGKEACFVIDVGNWEEKKVLSISLYAKDVATYDDFYGDIKLIETELKLGNKEPDGHEFIHKKMGELMGCAPDSTKTQNTHFHWVCSEPMNPDGLGSFMYVLIRAKKLNKKQVATVVEGCFK